MDFTTRVDGSLASTPLLQLLSELAAGAATGSVRVDGGSEIWLSEGRIYLVQTAGSPDLASVLFAADLGTVAEIGGHLADGSNSGLAALIAAHPGSERAVARLLHEFNLSALFEMLVPSEAAYHFEPGAIHPLGDDYAEGTAELIEQATGRVEIWRRIASRIPSTSAIFALETSFPSDSEERVVTADEWRFLSRLNGRNTVADVITETGESAFRVCSVLYRLLLEDLIVEAPSQ